MFEVIIVINNEEYTYGAYNNEDRANEIAMEVKRSIDTYVTKV